MKGVEKLELLQRFIVKILSQTGLMVYRTLGEFFLSRRTYSNLRFSLLYLPIALFLASLFLYYVIQYNASLVTTRFFYVLAMLVVVPLFGQGAKLARERFLSNFDISPESGWLNRVIVGLEVAIIFGVLNTLTDIIVGGVTGGFGSLIPSQITLPLIGTPQNPITISLDILIAFYVFPAAFVFYLHDEKISDLWPPSQFTPVVVNHQYVSLYLTWSIINYAGLQVASILFQAVVQSPWIPDENLRFLLAVVVAGWAFSIAISLSLFTIGLNGASVPSLVKESKILPGSTIQSTLTWFE